MCLLFFLTILKKSAYYSSLVYPLFQFKDVTFILKDNLFVVIVTLYRKWNIILRNYKLTLHGLKLEHADTHAYNYAHRLTVTFTVSLVRLRLEVEHADTHAYNYLYRIPHAATPRGIIIHMHMQGVHAGSAIFHLSQEPSLHHNYPSVHIIMCMQARYIVVCLCVCVLCMYIHVCIIALPLQCKCK